MYEMQICYTYPRIVFVKHTVMGAYTSTIMGVDTYASPFPVLLDGMHHGAVRASLHLGPAVHVPCLHEIHPAVQERVQQPVQVCAMDG